MWATLLLLGLTLNLEPNRIGLVPILLLRNRPTAQLGAYLLCSLPLSLAFGLAAVSMSAQTAVQYDGLGPRVQIVTGSVAVALAAGMAVRWLWTRRSSTDTAGGFAETGTPPAPNRHVEWIRKSLTKGQSPWLAGMIGLTAAVPSVDYLAMLAVISTSGHATVEKFTAVTVFIIIGSLVTLIPLTGCLLAPERTLELVRRFGVWATSRSLLEYAGIVFAAGLILIGLGWSHGR